MRNFMVLALTLLSLSICFGQPNYKVKEYPLVTGGDAKAFLKQAEEAIEKGEHNESIYYAAMGLKVADKKKEISECQAIIGRKFPKFIARNKETIAALEAKSATFQNDQTVTDRATILNLYTVINRYNGILSTMSPEKLKAAKKNDANLKLETKSYDDKVNQAQQRFNQGLEEAAKWHYDNALEMQNAGIEDDKEKAKAAALRFRFAYSYVDNYMDSKERYAACRELGTTKFKVSEFKNTAYGGLGAQISSRVVSLVKNNLTDFEFFEIVEGEEADAMLTGDVVANTIDRNVGDGGKKEHKKKIKTGTRTVTKDNGTTKEEPVFTEITAYSYWRWKKSVANVNVLYKIVENGSGTVLASGEANAKDEWNKDWSHYQTGNRKALPTLNTTEPSYPERVSQTNKVMDKIAEKLASQIANYAKQGS